MRRVPRSLAACSFGLLLSAALGWGCASAPSPPDIEDAPSVIEATMEDARESETPAAEPVAEPVVAREDLTVVIDEADEDAPGSMTLLEASRAERERRRTAPPPAIVITDENLSEYAVGELTIAQTRIDLGEETADSEDRAGAGGADSDEDYWRGRILEARQRWRSTIEEIEHLNSRVAELRRRFYAEDDPYYRDTQIKPAWDRSLERLAEARADAERLEAEVTTILEEGRRAGALPGWLREGLELEPEDQGERRREVVPEHEPREPQEIDEGGGGA